MLNNWTPERLRALDVAVAEARGWTPFPYALPDVLPASYVARNPAGELWCPSERVHISTAVPLPTVRLGCRETFDLMESLEGRRSIVPVDGRQWQIGPDVAPTIAITICLAYLAAMGKSFEGGA